MTTPDLNRLAEIRKREQEASNGPWWYDGRDIFHKKYGTNLDAIIVPLPETWHKTQAVPDADAEFIAHARDDIPWLLSKLATAYEPLERIAARYCLHTKGDVREESACLDKPADQWCSVCIARVAIAASEPAPEPDHFEGHIGANIAGERYRSKTDG